MIRAALHAAVTPLVLAVLARLASERKFRQ